MKRNLFKFTALKSFKVLCTVNIVVLTCVMISAQTVATKKLGRVNLFAGVWETVSNQVNRYRMTLQQDGRRVTGTYQPHNGTIDGEIDGAVLRFKWTQGDQRGSRRFVLSKNGRSFNGSWSNSNDPDDALGGTWNGTFLGKEGT